MTNEEKFIIESLGKENPFRVPEGYFDHFAEQFMNELPEAPTPCFDGCCLPMCRHLQHHALPQSLTRCSRADCCNYHNQHRR